MVDIQNAFVASPPHLANQVNTTYTQVGIGTWVAPTGRIWVTQVFRKPLVYVPPAPVGFPVSSTLAPTVSAFAGVLVAPLGSEYAVPGGIEQDFQGGDVLWGPSTGGRVVQGGIRDRYRAVAGPRSTLGLPVTNQGVAGDGAGRFNHFQQGTIVWTPSIGARDVRGAIRDRWAATGWERGPIGCPITGEGVTGDGAGRFNHFQRGSIVWDARTGQTRIV